MTLQASAYSYEPGETPMIGYYRVLGLRCKTGMSRQTIESFTDDGTVDWDKSDTVVTNPNRHAWKMRRYFQAIDEKGFWFVSGRALYGASNED